MSFTEARASTLFLHRLHSVGVTLTQTNMQLLMTMVSELLTLFS